MPVSDGTKILNAGLLTVPKFLMPIFNGTKTGTRLTNPVVGLRDRSRMTISGLCQKSLPVRTGVCVCVSCLSVSNSEPMLLWRHDISISYFVTVDDWSAEASRHDSVNVASWGSLPLTTVDPTCLPWWVILRGNRLWNWVQLFWSWPVRQFIASNKQTLEPCQSVLHLAQ